MTTDCLSRRRLRVTPRRRRLDEYLKKPIDPGRADYKCSPFPIRRGMLSEKPEGTNAKYGTAASGSCIDAGDVGRRSAKRGKWRREHRDGGDDRRVDRARSARPLDADADDRRGQRAARPDRRARPALLRG